MRLRKPLPLPTCGVISFPIPTHVSISGQIAFSLNIAHSRNVAVPARMNKFSFSLASRTPCQIRTTWILSRKNVPGLARMTSRRYARQPQPATLQKYLKSEWTKRIRHVDGRGWVLRCAARHCLATRRVIQPTVYHLFIFFLQEIRLLFACGMRGAVF